MSRQRPKCLALLFAQLFCVATGSAGGVVVTTLAGSLGHQSGSANGVGTASSFNFPRTVALSHDASFALIADTGNNAIRYINMTTSAVSTLAGATLVFGNADGTAATFNAPFGVAIAGGFALVSDAGSHIIRRIVISSALVSTLAGRPGSSGFTDGVGLAASFYRPQHVAISAGLSAVIADTGNHLVRVLDLRSSAVTTLAGSASVYGFADGYGSAAIFNTPMSVATDAVGSVVLVADNGNSIIRMITISSGLVQTLAGVAGAMAGADGIGSDARFYNPSGIAVDPSGSVAFVADTYTQLIRRIDVLSATVTTIAGIVWSAGHVDGAGSNAKFNSPWGITISADQTLALVTDINNVAIRAISMPEPPPPTQSPTASQAESPSQSASQSQTLSQVSSPTASQSPTAASTASSTRSQLPSRSHTQSPTQTQSQVGESSDACASTSTLPPTPTPPHPTPSSPLKQTGLPTPAPSGTRAPSPSTSTSPSETQSLPGSSSRSGSASSSVSTSKSAFGTQSTSQSRSETRTSSEAVTSTTTGTNSGSASKFATFTPTMSSTWTASSTTPASLIKSRTQTGSLSPRPSHVLRTQTVSSPPVRTPSQRSSPSSSDRPSRSETLRPSRTTTSTPSMGASTSPAPFALILSRGNAAVSDGLLLSDSLPPVSLAPTLSRCPQTASVALTCGSFGLSTNVTATEAAPSLVASTVPSTILTLACSGDSVAPLPLPVQVQLLASYGTSSFSGTVVCRATGADESGLGSAAINVSVVGSLWPTFNDAIIVLANGMSRSVAGFSPGAINSTCDLLRSLEERQQSRPRRIEVGSGIAAVVGFEAAISDVRVVLAAVQWSWGRIAIPPSSSGSPFNIALSGATPLVLRSRQRSFVDGTLVYVGGVLCNATAVSDDGLWLAVLTPSYDRLCGAVDGSSCSYAALTIKNPPSINDSVGSEPLRGATLSCPPFCSGAVADGIFPLGVASSESSSTIATSAASVNFVPATLTGAGGSATPLDLTSAGVGGAAGSIAKASGLFYAQACSVSGLYTDPATGACTNASDPASAACAFGAGDGCRPCPSNALCPGGLRAWPVPGYWSPGEGSADLLPCSAPGATKRCVGWNSAVGGVKCGVGYLQGSYLCGACAQAYFLSGDGTCSACPILPSLWVQYKGLFTLIVVVVAFAAVVYLTVIVGSYAAGLSIRVVSKDVILLIVSCFTIVQVLSTVAQDGSVRIGGVLRSIYDGVGLLQLQGLALPAACISSYPFASDVSVLSVAIGCWLAAVIAWFFWHRSASAYLVTFVCGAAAVYLHPTASFSAAKLLIFQNVLLSASGAAALDGGGSDTSKQVYSASLQLTQVSVVASNTFYKYFGTMHAPAGYLAVVALLTYIMMLPIVTLTLLWRDPWLAHQLAQPADKGGAERPPSVVHRSRRSSGIVVPVGADAAASDDDEDIRDPEAAVFADVSSNEPPLADPLLYPFEIGSDYAPHAWYWRHVDLCIVCGLSIIHALLPTPQTIEQVASRLAATLIFLTALAMLFVSLPNPYVMPWRRSVRVALLALSASCAAINAASRALDLGFGGAMLSATITPGAYCIICIFCVTVAALLVGFARELMEKALEQSDDVPMGKTDTKHSHVEHVSAARVHEEAALEPTHESSTRERSASQKHTRVPPQRSRDIVGEPAEEGLNSPSPWNVPAPDLTVRRRPPGGVTRASVEASSHAVEASPSTDTAPPRAAVDCRSGACCDDPVDASLPRALPGAPAFRARSAVAVAGRASLASPHPGLPVSSVLGSPPGSPTPMRHHRPSSMAALRTPSCSPGTAFAGPGLQQVSCTAAATDAQVPLPGSSLSNPSGLWALSTHTAVATRPPRVEPLAALAQFPGALRVRRASCSTLPSHAFAPTGAMLGGAVGSPMLAGAPVERRRQSFLLASASITLK